MKIYILILIVVLFSANSAAQSAAQKDDTLSSGDLLARDVVADLALGKELAFTRSKGNCLACHYIAGGEFPGNFGPPLVMMKDRYPDIEKLKAQIFDASTLVPFTTMPPFGRHKILTQKEIDLVTNFIITL